MRAISLIILATTFSLFNLKAQKENNIWYFGENAGIDFTSGKAVVLTNSPMRAVEGSACVSDKNGKILFYTNSETIWNKKHQVMKNGEGLAGFWSSTQGSLIVPFPNDGNKFYVFTADGCENSGAKGLCYSVVDISLDNGNGEVIVKNKELFKPVSEKLISVKHKNGKDTWVIAHDFSGTTFHVYLVSAKGISSEAIKSSTGTNFQSNFGAGQMKISPNAKVLACAIYNAGSDVSNVDMFHFDNTTGKISDHIAIKTAQSEGYCYGLEFSKSSNKMYVGTAMAKKLYQFDVSEYDQSKINKSIEHIGTTTTSYLWAFQMAPDGKIYVAKDAYPTGDNFLGVIENPEKDGKACGYNDKAFDLGGRAVHLGFPNAISTTIQETSTDKDEQGNYRISSLDFTTPDAQPTPTIHLKPQVKPQLQVQSIYGYEEGYPLDRIEDID